MSTPILASCEADIAPEQTRFIMSWVGEAECCGWGARGVCKKSIDASEGESKIDRK
jgi:hypothetical protein